MSLGYQANAEKGGHSISNSAYLRVLIACRFSMSFFHVAHSAAACEGQGNLEPIGRWTE
jgi:hypothetical protein